MYGCTEFAEGNDVICVCTKFTMGLGTAPLRSVHRGMGYAHLPPVCAQAAGVWLFSY